MAYPCWTCGDYSRSPRSVLTLEGGGRGRSRLSQDAPCWTSRRGMLLVCGGRPACVTGRPLGCYGSAVAAAHRPADEPGELVLVGQAGQLNGHRRHVVRAVG